MSKQALKVQPHTHTYHAVLYFSSFRGPYMRLRKQKGLQPRSSGDLAEVEEQIKLWSSKAAELRPNIMAFAFALSVDASQILFKGDLIVFNAPTGRDSDVGLPTLDLAAIRNIVCNLKILQTQREQLEGKKASTKQSTHSAPPYKELNLESLPALDRNDDRFSDTRLGNTDTPLRPPRTYL